MKLKRQMGKTAAVIVVLSLLAVCAAASSQTSGDPDGPPSLVEVYWQSSKTVVAPGITNLIILDPEIARAEVGYDTIQFFGLERGETVALGYRNDKPVSIRVRVLQRPPLIVSPAMLRRQSEMASGTISSTMLLSN